MSVYNTYRLIKQAAFDLPDLQVNPKNKITRLLKGLQWGMRRNGKIIQDQEKYKIKKASKLYTYVDLDADLSQGLLSMRNAPEFAIINKYKNKVKDPANLNKEYLIKRMEELDPTKPDWIYAFDAPIPDKANEGLIRFRDTHKLVEWDPEQVKDVIKLLRRYHHPKTREEVPADFKPLKYMRWIKGKDNMSFRHSPVYKVLTESGKIPPELLTYE